MNEGGIDPHRTNGDGLAGRRLFVRRSFPLRSFRKLWIAMLFATAYRVAGVIGLRFRYTVFAGSGVPAFVMFHLSVLSRRVTFHLLFHAALSGKRRQYGGRKYKDGYGRQKGDSGFTSCF
jgi:hypothetical protein